MKKISMFIACLFLMSSLSFALNPPAAVKKAFEQKFPNASKVKWGKESKTEWEAEFTDNGKKISANFEQSGAWVETESSIQVSELPKAVTAAIQKNYSKWKIVKAYKTETAKQGIVFEAEMKSGKQKKSVEFKEDGTEVKG